MASLLACTGVGVRFGGVVALDGVDFVVDAGSVTGCIGPNGAGKTTLFNAITGMVDTAAGDIRLTAEEGQGDRNGDRSLVRVPPHRRAGLGVVRTFQNLEIFPNMTVLENVLVGCHRRLPQRVVDALLRTPRFFATEREARRLAMEALEFVDPALAAASDTAAGELSFGEQRALELARALAAAPRLLLLDEPAAGLNMQETKALGALIKRIRQERGVTIALVEHDMELVMDVCDVISVLQFGKLLARGTPRQIQQDPRVLAAYLGDDDETDPDAEEATA
ncbi:ABC transporter ATP-binding protein [Megalodesulfovibrio paquesii]